MAYGELTREAIDYADSTMVFVGAGFGDRAHRKVLFDVADGRSSGDAAARATARRHGVVIDRAMNFAVGTFDEYLIPGSTILRSRITDSEHPLGITDIDQLRTVELQLSQLRVAELVLNPIVGRYDYEHMRRIHHQMFQDVWPWAGEQRVGPDTPLVRFARDATNYAPGDPAAPMVKHTYYRGSEIADAASIQFAQLEMLLNRRDLPREFFLKLLAEVAAELITIHCFRDGNLRAQWVYALFFNRAVGVPMDVAAFLADRSLSERTLHSLRNYQMTGNSQHLENLADVTFVTPEASRMPR